MDTTTMVNVDGVEMTLAQALAEKRRLEDNYRRLDLVRKDLDHHPDLDEVDTPDLSDALAELAQEISERQVAIARAEGADPASSYPPPNLGGRRL